MSSPSPDAARAALRAFVRTHHPDVGGDPVAFREGLAELRAALGVLATAPSGRAGGSWPAPDDPRLDAPVVAVSDRHLARLGRLGRRLARRYDPRRGSARVQ
ncbi:hypothetical protein [Actinomycetospora cinnamomea]|uniref:J domain-containing protein n=1 Tax=Actinomycetospora cinnamomea TaxID=663609 RepID=A0A2U1FPU0_9PSEU|nr:hypothetical protein [Actinomycetospora cinnamomea]PVZ14201.1 hypothetical protein C8D89_10165 [Actinomycetospora cinnamomea]